MLLHTIRGQTLVVILDIQIIIVVGGETFVMAVHQVILIHLPIHIKTTKLALNQLIPMMREMKTERERERDKEKETSRMKREGRSLHLHQVNI